MIPPLDNLRRSIQRRLALYQAAKSGYQKEKDNLERLKERQEALKKAQVIAQTVAQKVQEQAYIKIADVVSRSLAAVFGDTYLFKLMFETKRGRTEAKLYFEKDGIAIDPMTAAGGGIVDVAAFALRLSCLLLSNPKRRRTVVMDEPFRFVSRDYREPVARLLVELSKELDVQFILVTHMAELEVGKVVRL